MTGLRKVSSGRLPERRALLLRLLCAVVAVVTLPVAAAEPEGRYAFRAYGDDEGLKSPSPELLLQDRAGFLWVGTADGLYRFDGSTFHRFGTEDGLPSARITALHETLNGRLYVGTRSGLARWDGTLFLPLTRNAGLPEQPIGGVASDKDGTIFVGTPKGLFLSVSDFFHVDARRDRRLEQPIYALHVEAPGRLVFAREGQLFAREKGSDTEIGSAKGLPPLARIDAILSDGDRRLWVRTRDALYSLGPGAARFEKEPSVPAALVWGRLQLGRDGALLVPTGSGLFTRKDGAWRALTKRQGLPDDRVLEALEERQGSLFLAIAGGGLVQRPGEGAFTLLTREDGLPAEAVFSVARDRAGALWVGTPEGAARLRADGTFQTITERDGLAGKAVFALAAGADGSMWAGSWPGGVTRLGPKTGETKRYPGVNEVAALHATPAGDVYAATPGGVFRLSAGGSRFEKVAIPGGDEQDAVYDFAEVKGVLYAGGRLGLQRVGAVDGAAAVEPKRFRRRTGLKSDFVSSLATEGDALLVAYRDSAGLDRVTVEGEKVLVGAPHEGYEPKRVAFIGHDHSGNLWVGASGLDVFLKGRGRLRLDKDSGLPSEELTLNAFTADPDGAVWIGTLKGLLRFRPRTPLAPMPGPPVAFSSASAGTRPLRVDKPAVLSLAERNLQVSWAGLAYTGARGLRYRYRVVGVDEQPLLTSLNEVHLKGLPPGDYRVEVSALTPAGATSEKPAVFAFEILPAWYQTWWARLLGLALLGLGIYGLVQQRTTALRHERQSLQDRLDLTVAELSARTSELEQASLSDTLTDVRNRRFFFAMVPGEIERSIRMHAPFLTPFERRSGELVFTLVDVGRHTELRQKLGEQAGDAVLLEVVRRLKGVVRGSDYLVRWEDSSFLVMTRSTSREQAPVLVERLLATLAGEPVQVAVGGETRSVPLQITMGWAPFPWFVEQPAEVRWEETLRVADRALAAAGRAGTSRGVGALPLTVKRESPAPGPGDRLEGVEGLALRLVVTEVPVGRRAVGASVPA